MNMMKRWSILLLALFQLVMSVASQRTASPTPAPIPAPTPSPTTAPTNVTDLPWRIDTHCHYVPPFYKELLDSRNITSGGRPIPSWNATAHLAVSAQYGIVTSVVAVSTPGAKLAADAPIEEGRTLARQVNEYGYNITKEYPGRFLFWATLTLPDLEGAIAEAIYALDTLGAAGVIIEASVYGELLGTPRYAPLYKVLDDRKAVVFVHPSNSPCPDAPDTLPLLNATDIPSYVIDFLLDTSRAALNLVFRNVTTDYPNIKFVLSHSGGFLPFAATRAAGGLVLMSNYTFSRDYYLQKLSEFYVDLAISASPTSLPSTTAFFQSTRITYGTDYPYAPSNKVNNDDLLAYRLGSRNRQRIDYNNAHRLFKKFLY